MQRVRRSHRDRGLSVQLCMDCRRWTLCLRQHLKEIFGKLFEMVDTRRYLTLPLWSFWSNFKLESLILDVCDGFSFGSSFCGFVNGKDMLAFALGT